MLHDSEHDASWLAIRQPAVIRLLERELGTSDRDADAFAAGLALSCQILGGARRSDLRLDHRALAASLASVRAGRCDTTMIASIRAQIRDLATVLTSTEEDKVATVVAALIWAVFDSSLRGLEDTLVA